MSTLRVSALAPAQTTASRSARAAAAPLGAAAAHSVRGAPLSLLSTSAVRPARAQARASTVRVSASAADAVGKKVCVITGASSGLGLNGAKSVADQPGWHVVLACRDFAKAERAAKEIGMKAGSYTVMHCDLASMASVRQFADAFLASGMSLDTLVANGAIYLPTAEAPTYNADGWEISVATNHLGHFLLCNLLLPKLSEGAKANPGSKRMVIVGSVTGNTNTMAGNIPPKADLGDLQGLAAGFQDPICMIDGGEFDGAKAYKDAKVCNMLTMREFHRRYAAETGVVFSSLYPGCIADTQLFRNHFELFRQIFPKFQKYVTKGEFRSVVLDVLILLTHSLTPITPLTPPYATPPPLPSRPITHRSAGYVSQPEAGKRLASVATDPKYTTSEAYWSWEGEDAGGAFVNTPSAEVQDGNKGERLWELSEKLVGIKSKVAA